MYMQLCETRCGGGGAAIRRTTPELTSVQNPPAFASMYRARGVVRVCICICIAHVHLSQRRVKIFLTEIGNMYVSFPHAYLQLERTPKDTESGRLM